MANHDRIEIHEIIAQARLEPGVRQVFLEGNFDVKFHRWLFEGSGAGEATFLPIDSVEVPVELIKKHGQSRDNHGELLTLGLELALRDHTVSQVVRCFPDGEFDYVLGKVVNAPTIEYLDATSPEALG